MGSLSMVLKREGEVLRTTKERKESYLIFELGIGF
jgi:hypothetical protein